MTTFNLTYPGCVQVCVARTHLNEQDFPNGLQLKCRAEEQKNTEANIS